jgi:hypothetical protein
VLAADKSIWQKLQNEAGGLVNALDAASPPQEKKDAKVAKVLSLQFNGGKAVEKGVLTAKDAALKEGGYYKEFIFEAKVGQRFRIELNSKAFIPYLYLKNGVGQSVNQSGFGSDNALIERTITKAGTYYIIATSWQNMKTGDFLLTVDQTDGAPPPKEQKVTDSAGNDHRAAQLVLSFGGRVFSDDRNRWLAKDLPAGPWTLRGIDLSNTKVKDADLKRLGLGGLKSLESLWLKDTNVGNEGLKELAGLTELQALHLHGTKVTNEGLKELTGLTGLKTLMLFNTQVSDKGLKDLSGLKGLTLLNLEKTTVTAAGVAELRKALPKKVDIRR